VSVKIRKIGVKMSLPTTDELISLVHELNISLEEQTGKEYVRFTYTTDGFVDEICFAGIELWNSEADDRVYIDEESDIKESISQHIKKVLKEDFKIFASFEPDKENNKTDEWIDMVTGRSMSDEVDFDESDTIVQYKDTAYRINSRMARDRGLTRVEVIAIRDFHVQKLEIFEQMKKEKDPTSLKQYAKLIEHIEYEIQELWKFPKDRSWHEWYAVPKCMCPKMDNRERRGTNYQIISSECPIHGQHI